MVASSNFDNNADAGDRGYTQDFFLFLLSKSSGRLECGDSRLIRALLYSHDRGRKLSLLFSIRAHSDFTP